MARAPSPYDLDLAPEYRELDGVLRFSDLPSAEASIRRLDEFCQRFAAAGDKKGVEVCRRIALAGRRRAEALGRSRRIRPEKRLEKQEAATWFATWLESPAIFSDWLELRKSSEEYRRLRTRLQQGSIGEGLEERPDGGRE
jgi:hypothetical protein